MRHNCTIAGDMTPHFRLQPNSLARKDAETFPCLSESFGFLANGDELGELGLGLGAGRFKKRSMSNNYQAIS